jgi:hypothetical protein
LLARFFSFVLAAALLLVASPAWAQKVEQQARQMQKKAMEEDYLATEFGKAVDKLNQAIAKCGNDKCSPQLRAQLRRDLGVVLIGGQIDKEKGIQQFREAMQVDGNVQLDPDIKTKELEAAWEQAKKTGGGAAPAGGGGTQAPTGDFVHVPAVEQVERTPVPIYAEYNGSESIVKVLVRYKGFGMTEFKSFELRKMGTKGWGGMPPCLDVQKGDFVYYIQGFNDQNDPVATAGDRSHPYKVPIKAKIEGEAPHLPGETPPAPCADTGDCPPNFPGCKKGGAGAEEKAGNEAGADCEEDNECQSGTCKNNKCTAPKEEEGQQGKFKRFWVGFALAVDVSLLASADDVCLLKQDATPVNDANYYCTRQNDEGGYSANSDFPDRNDKSGAENKEIQPSSSSKLDKVQGGTALGNIRIFATFDYAFTPNVMAGVRAGYVFGTYPGASASNDGKTSQLGPFHLELRGMYVIGKDALAKAGLAPYITVGGGYAPWDTKVPAGVTVKCTDANCGVPGGSSTNKTVDAYQIAGPIFVTGGGGIRYAFAPRVALLTGLRVNFAFGGGASAPSGGLEAGMQFGF